MGALRDRLLSTRAGIVAWNFLANQANRFRLPEGSRVRLSVSRRTDAQADHIAGYTLHMWEEVRRWLPAEDGAVRGKRVLELGPGDHTGLLLRALAAGAASATGADKFTPERDGEFNARVYRALRGRIPETERPRYDGALAGGGVRELFDCPVERLQTRLPAASADLIFSRSVLEYVRGLDAAFRAMATVLAPGGWMVHKVDARDDGLFSSHGQHPLAFLTLSPRVYRSMTSHTYRPGQARASDFLAAARGTGLETRMHICRVLGQPGELPEPVEALREGRDYGVAEMELLRRIRPRLAPAFAQRTDADLLAAGFHLVCRKPA